ncbi:MAG: MBL fold metallo-hydrolase [Deltaproteobacteria bacterium]|nr:MBL fold metallo-hydrolase [Deltaproteobacteria bacterium]
MTIPVKPKDPQVVAPGVFLVGGPDFTDSRDCLCYLAVGNDARVLLDFGAGPSAERILELACQAGGAPPTHLLLTHAHIDHAGGAAHLAQETGLPIMVHRLDAQTLAQGDPHRSAATWYGLQLTPVENLTILTGGETLPLDPGRLLTILHAPGHTPGSLAAWCPAGDYKVLFAQDLHGPFLPEFGSDLEDWRRSMDALLELRADVLCEGHFGVYRPREKVEAYIRHHLRLQGH